MFGRDVVSLGLFFKIYTITTNTGTVGLWVLDDMVDWKESRNGRLDDVSFKDGYDVVLRALFMEDI